MPSNDALHLHDVKGNRLCNCDGPAVDASIILQDDYGMVFCATCARAVLAPIVGLIHTRCSDGVEHHLSDGHLLLQVILSLATTPPDEEGTVLRIMGPVLGELGCYVEGAGADHA